MYELSDGKFIPCVNDRTSRAPRFVTCTASQSLTVEATRWSFASDPSTQRITLHTNRPRQDLLPRSTRETRFSALPPLKSA